MNQDQIEAKQALETLIKLAQEREQPTPERLEAMNAELEQLHVPYALGFDPAYPEFVIFFDKAVSTARRRHMRAVG